MRIEKSSRAIFLYSKIFALLYAEILFSQNFFSIFCAEFRLLSQSLVLPKIAEFQAKYAEFHENLLVVVTLVLTHENNQPHFYVNGKLYTF